MIRLPLKLTAPPSAAPPPVQMADAAPGAERLRPVLEAYAQALGMPVTCHVPPQHFRAPQPATALHVHCFAVPRRPVLLGVWPRVPLVRLPFAFGLPLPAPDTRAFAPGLSFGRGRVLADAQGRPMVEVAGANLFVLLDLLPQGDLAPVLLRRCLDLGLAAFPSLASRSPRPPDARARCLAALARGTAEAEAAWHARARGEGRQRFQAACDARRQDEVEGLEQEIGALERSLAEYGRRITADTRLLAERRRRLRGLQDLPAGTATTVLEFDRIRDLPQVCHLDAQDGVLGIITHTLEAECGGRRFRLGAFRVEIHFDGDVRITNLTEPRGLYDHPHVRQARPCLGNVREGVAKLIGEYEFAAAAQVLIDFLQTVNPQDWRLPVFYWPRVER
jgi:hypothetical protein